MTNCTPTTASCSTGVRRSGSLQTLLNKNFGSHSCCKSRLIANDQHTWYLYYITYYHGLCAGNTSEQLSRRSCCTRWLTLRQACSFNDG